MNRLSLRVAAVSGASGFVGRAVVRALTDDGWEVLRLVRRAAGAGEIAWDPDAGTIDEAGLEGIDAVVHLAAESIAGLWTPAKKRRILESRVRGTRLLATALAGLSEPPQTLVTASGVGYYGDAGDDLLTESSPAGDDFMARTCVAWEAAAAAASGIRVVHTRFGIVLHPAGGALRLMLPAFRLGLGARLGNGRQWLSWISLRDAARVVRFVIDRPDIAGGVNSVAPGAVRNADFTRTLASVLGRPAPFAIPAWALRTFSGGMADSLLLASQHAVPAVLTEKDFTFDQPYLRTALTEGLDANA
ncbi:MAG: TIGR01777 family oxidoreductase [Gemmatimonadota bacterium]